MLDATHFLLRSLVASRDLTQADVERATLAAGRGGDIVAALVAQGTITARRLTISRARVCETPYLDLEHCDVDIRNAERLPRSLAERVVALVVCEFDGVATVAMENPLDLQAIDQIRQVLAAEIDPVLCEATALRALISRAYSMARTTEGDADSNAEVDLAPGDTPIVAAINQILAQAAAASASDIHLNPDERDLHIRFRIDGVLTPQQGPARSAHERLVQRLKVMARLDLTLTRLPQDGKFRFMHEGQAIDVRLSLVPTINGENAVLRLLRPSVKISGIMDLEMPPAMGARFRGLIERPLGLVLATGPTGSGKTTTLYSALAHLNSPDVNIITIEDPVEIRLPMIRQIQVSADLGLTFATALRSVLRQDPDVVLVGEIRDAETARIATQAAMTGHLVLATMHTNDAVGAIARLADLDVPAFAVNASLLCVLGQRLVRRVCAKCAAAAPADTESLVAMGVPPDQARGLRRGSGCAACRKTGYRGRLGVYEMLEATPAVQAAIERRDGEAPLRAAARTAGLTPMWEDGVNKACAGLTTFDELKTLWALADPRAALPAHSPLIGVQRLAA